jgi:hypothetical protein
VRGQKEARLCIKLYPGQPLIPMEESRLGIDQTPMTSSRATAPTHKQGISFLFLV